MIGPGRADSAGAVLSFGPLEIHCFTGGAFAENAFLLHCTETDRWAVVDPGASAPDMVRRLEERSATVDAIYLTHAHLDHVEGIPAIREFTDAPIHLHPSDRPLYDKAERQAEHFGLTLAGPLPPPDRTLEPGADISVGERALEVRFAPGHAPGHVLFYSAEGGVAVVGDVIFAGSIGRTDLPGGDFQALISSIRSQVLTLPDETRLLPGHGSETTVERERRGNPFLISQAPGELA